MHNKTINQQNDNLILLLLLGLEPQPGGWYLIHNITVMWNPICLYKLI
jgi:hypothetical protein